LSVSETHRRSERPHDGSQGSTHPTGYKRDVIDKQMALMQKRGIWKKPAK
jgi:hypothetical protein